MVNVEVICDKCNVKMNVIVRKKNTVLYSTSFICPNCNMVVLINLKKSTVNDAW